MADGIFLKSGGGVTSEDVNIGRYQALKGTRLLTSDSDDEVVSGTMPDNSTRTSNGSVPGISSAVSGIPTRRGENMHITTNTDGESVLNIAPTQGYYPGNRESYINRPASELGNATAAQVLAGTSFSSENGLAVQGGIPIWDSAYSGWSDVVYAAGDEIKWGDDVRGNRGFYVKLLNGYYLKGANWAFGYEPNLRPENIRAGVSIAGLAGTLIDYENIQKVFDGASFFGFLKDGAVYRTTKVNYRQNRMMSSPDDEVVFTPNGVRHTGGAFWNVFKVGGSSENADTGFVSYKSIPLRLFRQIKLGVRVELHSATHLYRGVQLFLKPIHDTTRRDVTTLISEFKTGSGYQELVVDVSALQENAFLQFNLNVATNAGTAIMYGTIHIESIELIK